MLKKLIEVKQTCQVEAWRAIMNKLRILACVSNLSASIHLSTSTYCKASSRTSSQTSALVVVCKMPSNESKREKAREVVDILEEISILLVSLNTSHDCCAISLTGLRIAISTEHSYLCVSH